MEILIAILNLIPSVINVVRSFIIDEKISLNVLYCVVILTAVLVLLPVLFLFFILHFRKLAESRLYSYYEFFKIIRSTKVLYYKIAEQYENGTLTKELLDVQSNGVIQDTLDCLCEIFHREKGCEFHSCVKIFECDSANMYNNSMSLTQDNDPRVVAHVQSSNSEDIPFYDNEPKKVSENSDLAEILFERKKYFYKGNLPKYQKDLDKCGKKYKNTTQNWKTYYKATIVVPIGSSYYRGERKEYRVLGFLCVDTLSTCAFKDNKRAEKINTDIVKTFADSLCTDLEYYRYYERILK